MACRKRCIIFGVFLVLAAITAGAPDLRAMSLAVSPPRLDLTVRSGQTVKGKIVVSGDFDGVANLTASLTDWDLGSDGNPRFQSPGSLPRSLAGWLRVEPARFAIGPGQVKVVNYELRVPSGISGTYWGAIFFSMLPAGGKSPGIHLAGRMSTTIYATQPAGSVLDARIERVRAEYAGGRLKAELILVNRGGIVMRGGGEFRLETAETGKAAVRAGLGTLTVLPGGTRRVETAWTGRLAPGRYLPIYTVTPVAGKPLERQGPVIIVSD